MSTVITDEQAKLNISANLCYLLKERDISQSDLARLTGENCMRISLAVRGQHLPSAGFLARLAEALDVTTEELLQKTKQRARAEAS